VISSTHDNAAKDKRTCRDDKAPTEDVREIDSRSGEAKSMSEDKPFTAKSFQDSLKERRLMGNFCEECKTLMVPPRIMCIECRGKKLRWSQLSGKGILETFTVVHVAPTFLKDKAPYAVGIVKLNEGPMLTARLVNVDVQRPETIKIGVPMIIDYTEEEGKTLLVFKPA